MRPLRVLFLVNHATLGELHPMLGLGRALRAAGHDVRVAVSPGLAHHVRAAELEPVAVGRDFDPGPPSYWDTVRENLFDQHRGFRQWLERHVLPEAAHWLEACLPIALASDCLVAAPLACFAPKLAARSERPWIEVALSPYSDPSAYEQAGSLGSGSESSSRRRRVSIAVDDLLLRAAKARIELAISPDPGAGRSALVRERALLSADRAAPVRRVAAFSRHFANPRREVPLPFTPIGFVPYDGVESAPLGAALESFLSAGAPPLLLTLGGEASVFRPGALFDAFAEALDRRPACRGILLVNSEMVDALRPRYARPNLFVAGYTPFERLLPRSCAMIHQGAPGAIGRALQHGVPSLAIGHAADHRYNGALLAATGAGLAITPKQANQALDGAVQRLLDDRALAQRARQLAEQLREESPSASFVQIVEGSLAARTRSAATELHASRA